MESKKMEKIVSLCKRRGIIFPSSEIYGGLGSCWDYGPIGVLLKNNVKSAWFKNMVQERDDVVGLDSSILMHPKIWEASGHIKNFTDPLVDCKSCKQRFKATDIIGDKCPECGGELTSARQFNLMFKTFLGPVEDSSSVAYLRPETAQGIFVNFKNVQTTMRMKIPFGIAQIGKAFRNEITPGNFTFRTREFEQMELEYFVHPTKADEYFEYWVNERFNWYKSYGIKENNLRLRHHEKDELAHYAKSCADIEYNFPFGWSELEGIANRTDFDLKQHLEYSGKDLYYFDEITKEKYLPYIIEPSAGADRATLAFLIDAYEEVVGGRESIRGKIEDREEGRDEAILKLDKRLSPIKVAVFPLMKKSPLKELSEKVYNSLKKYFITMYDEVGSIGKRYRRQDEIGTPYCITIDYQSIEDNTVTIRDRNTMLQERVNIDKLIEILREKLEC